MNAKNLVGHFEIENEPTVAKQFTWNTNRENASISVPNWTRNVRSHCLSPFTIAYYVQIDRVVVWLPRLCDATHHVSHLFFHLFEVSRDSFPLQHPAPATLSFIFHFGFGGTSRKTREELNSC
jgi:hypothetical protein